MAIDLKNEATRQAVRLGFTRLMGGYGNMGLLEMEKMMAGEAPSDKETFVNVINSLLQNMGLADSDSDGRIVQTILGGDLGIAGARFDPGLTPDIRWSLLIGALQARTGLRVTCEANRPTWEKIIRYIIAYGEM